MANVLIVEDEFILAMDIQASLEDAGEHCVGIADSYDSAMDLAKGGADIALVDLNLADGPTGVKVGTDLKTTYGIQVIFVTANPAQLDGPVEGTIGFMVKPVSGEALVEAIRFAAADAVNNPKDNVPPGLKTFRP